MLIKSFALLGALLMPALLWAQFSLTGTINDDQGQPLPGANVVLTPGQQATATNADGQYRFEALAAGNYQLRVSFVGYSTREIRFELDADRTLDVSLKEDIQLKEEVIVYATRANEKTPTTFDNINLEEIESRNLGQDMPIILNFSPSLVSTSDAGNGVGYTGIRIRGSDPTRINVTINGIPVNDSESHGVFWVNMPDFASSVNNIQIQRGVGASTNGAAAFGATVNLQTAAPDQEAYGQIDNSFGSFDTWRHTFIVNSGLINDRWAFQGRLSKITSDGYIDRAESNLQSYFLSGTYYGDKTIVKALTFAGKERTYQSWWGTPEARLENDVEGMQAVIANNGYTEAQAQNLLNSGRTFNYYLYDNEVDNYQQDHYQLHVNHTFSPYFNLNGALHYTYGRGYFEQYRNDDDFADYGLDPVEIGGETVSSTDLIRRRWLDNDFYGLTFSANYEKDDWLVTLGGGYNEYEGDHFGEIIWARFAGDTEIRENYYDNVGTKEDFNIFLKSNYQITPKLNLYGDLQLRTIDYRTVGADNDLRFLDTGGDYAFFNPKFGFTYSLSNNTSLYASYAIGNREPVRNDFVDAPDGVTPEHETLRNVEAGIRKQGNNFSFNANYYLMDYKNQLVLTGELNDVGANIRTNVPSSYRTGIELVGTYQFSDKLRWEVNLTLSQNKINNFTEVIYDYGEAFDEFNVIENEFENTDISFSPNVIGASQLTCTPVENLSFQLLSKYVGQQYLDNTANEDRAIDPYFTNDIKVDFVPNIKHLKELRFSLLINNIFDVMYSANGYTFGYGGGGTMIRENYFYPQAGTNFLFGISAKF